MMSFHPLAVRRKQAKTTPGHRYREEDHQPPKKKTNDEPPKLAVVDRDADDDAYDDAYDDGPPPEQPVVLSNRTTLSSSNELNLSTKKKLNRILTNCT